MTTTSDPVDAKTARDRSAADHLAIARRDMAEFRRQVTGAVVAVVAGTLSVEDRLYSKRAPVGGISLGDVLDSLVRQGLRPRHVDPANASFFDDLQAADLVFINMHGEYGEDGRLQGTLDYLGKPYTGSGVLAGAVALNKLAFKRVMSGCQVPIPRYGVLHHGDLQLGVNQEPVGRLPLPVMAKPISGGSSIGMQLLKTPQGVRSAGTQCGDLFLEEFIPGAAVTVAVLDLGGLLTPSPPVHVSFDTEFYDAEVKIGSSRASQTAYLALDADATVGRAVRSAAVDVHQLVGCRGFCRVDFIVTESGAHFVLEVNTIPGLTRRGNFVACTQRLGLTYDETVLSVLRSCLLPHPVPA